MNSVACVLRAAGVRTYPVGGPPSTTLDIEIEKQ
jgi:hypothetical protein